MKIDEAGRNVQSAEIELRVGSTSSEVSDLSDVPSPDADVGAEGSRAGAVEHGAVAQDHVVGLLLRLPLRPGNLGACEQHEGQKESCDQKGWMIRHCERAI